MLFNISDFDNVKEIISTEKSMRYYVFDDEISFLLSLLR